MLFGEILQYVALVLAIIGLPALLFGFDLRKNRRPKTAFDLSNELAKRSRIQWRLVGGGVAALALGALVFLAAKTVQRSACADLCAGRTPTLRAPTTGKLRAFYPPRCVCTP